MDPILYEDTNIQSPRLQHVLSMHLLRLPRLQPCLWGTNLKGSNPISSSDFDLVSWGLWSSRAPTLSSKAPTLPFRGSNLLGSNPYFISLRCIWLYFMTPNVFFNKNYQYPIMSSLSLHITSSMKTLFFTWRCHQYSSLYPYNSFKSPHDEFNHA